MGLFVGDSDGPNDGKSVGHKDGIPLGSREGDKVGDAVGLMVGIALGMAVGSKEWVKSMVMSLGEEKAKTWATALVRWSGLDGLEALVFSFDNSARSLSADLPVQYNNQESDVEVTLDE